MKIVMCSDYVVCFLLIRELSGDSSGLTWGGCEEFWFGTFGIS